MVKYEIIYIIDATLSEDEIKAMVEKFTAFIEANSTVEKIDEWGKKKLAYLINKKSEGYYVCANVAAAPEFPALIERQFRINEGILKHLIVKLDK